MTVVASYPLLTEQVAAGSKDRKAYKAWIQLNIRWLKQMFGERLVSVIEHTDEKHPHIHAFILPIGDPACSARELNPAWLIKEEVEALAKSNKHPAKDAVKMGNAAYRARAREIQDDYYKAVGEPVGLTRTGPKRARLSRSQWKAEKEDARRKAELLSQMDNRVQAISEAEIQMDSEADRLSEEIAAKLELAETILKDALRVQNEAEQSATARMREQVHPKSDNTTRTA